MLRALFRARPLSLLGPCFLAAALFCAPTTAAAGDDPKASQTLLLDRTEAHLSDRQIEGYWSPAFRACLATNGHGALQSAECASHERDVQGRALDRALKARLAHLPPSARKAELDLQTAWEAAFSGACSTHGHGFSASAAIGFCRLDHLIRRRAALERR